MNTTQDMAFWYLSRASAFVALFLTWLSMVFGLLLTSKAAKKYPGVLPAFELHEFTSLLGLAFGAFHALILMGDQYFGYTLAQLVLPFNSTGFKPVWVGLGQLGFYVLALVSFTFYARRFIGQRAWRLIHFASFAAFAMAVAHGITSGSDTNTLWASLAYWFCGVSVALLTMYRVMAKRLQGAIATPSPLG